MSDLTPNKKTELEELPSYPSFRKLLLETAASDPVYAPIRQQLEEQLAKRGSVDKSFVYEIERSFSSLKRRSKEEEEQQSSRSSLKRLLLEKRVKDPTTPVHEHLKEVLEQEGFNQKYYLKDLEHLFWSKELQSEEEDKKFSTSNNFQALFEHIIREVEELSQVYSLLTELLLSLDDPFDQVLLGRVCELAEIDYVEHLRHPSAERKFSLPVFLGEISKRISHGLFPIVPDLEAHRTRLDFFFGRTIPGIVFEKIWDELHYESLFEYWFDAEIDYDGFIFPLPSHSRNPYNYYKSDWTTMRELVPLIVAQAKLESGIHDPDKLFQQATKFFDEYYPDDLQTRPLIVLLACLATEASDSLVVPYFREPLDDFYEPLYEWPPYDWGDRAFEFDSSYSYRNNMIWAMGLLAKPAFLPTLQEALETDLHTCEMAVWSLVQLGTEESIRLVRQARYGIIGAVDGDWDKNPALERAAAEVLEQANLPLDDPKVIVDYFMEEDLEYFLSLRVSSWFFRTSAEQMLPLLFERFQQSSEQSDRVRLATIMVDYATAKKSPYQPLYEVLKASPSLQEAVKEKFSKGFWDDMSVSSFLLDEDGELVFMSYFNEELEDQLRNTSNKN